MSSTQSQEAMTACSEVRSAIDVIRGAKTVRELLTTALSMYAESVAVRVADKTHSYAELSRRSDEIRERLSRLGVQPGDVIGLCLDRGFEFIAAVVATIQAGCTYLPLDPAYPEDRLSFMAQDANVKLALSLPCLAHRSVHLGVPVALLDDRAATETSGAVASGSAGGPHDAAVYIIYTSGTTGRPKGVPIFSSGLLNFIKSQVSYLDISPRSRLIQNASICFDMSVWEIFLALSAGASIAVVGNETLQDGRAFVNALDELGITHILLTPSMLSVMPHRPLQKLECIVSAGEKCSQGLIDRWAPGRRFYDAYGATEATVYTTIGQCFAGESERHVGRAMENTAVLVLDSALAPVPSGEVGEIYIAGIGVSRGYLNRAELSRERFLNSPHGLVYRTGDLGVLNPDKSLVYKGRADKQVKINGYRIELEEIEAVANSIPGVSGSFATTLTQGSEELRSTILVLYIVYTNPGELPARELKRLLGQKLPRHMLPSLIIEMESFPLTGSGKINARALPSPDIRSQHVLHSLRDHQTMLEFELSHIWSTLLGHNNFSLHDSFFDIGGHSLLANQLFSIIEEKFGTSMPVSTIFTYDTIVSLSEAIRGRQPARGYSPLVRLKEGTGQGKLYCVHPGGGTLFCYHELVRSLPDAWTVVGIQSANCDFAGPLSYRTIEEMAAAYVGHIRDDDATTNISLLGWSSGGLIAYEMGRLLSDSGVKVDYVGLVDSYLSGDYVEGIDLEDTVGLFYRVIHGRLIDPLPEATRARIAGLSDEAAMQTILDDAKKKGLVPAQYTLERALRSLEIHRENCLASRAYRPGSYSLPVTLFRGMENKDAGSNKMMGWDAVLGNSHRPVELEADHYSIILAPHVEKIVGTLPSPTGR